MVKEESNGESMNVIVTDLKKGKACIKVVT